MGRIIGKAKARMLMRLNHELESLLRKHRSLDEEVARLAKDPLADPVEVTAMKKLKLQLKEEIVAKETEIKKQEESESGLSPVPSGLGRVVYDLRWVKVPMPNSVAPATNQKAGSQPVSSGRPGRVVYDPRWVKE